MAGVNAGAQVAATKAGWHGMRRVLYLGMEMEVKPTLLQVLTFVPSCGVEDEPGRCVVEMLVPSCSFSPLLSAGRVV